MGQEARERGGVGAAAAGATQTRQGSSQRSRGEGMVRQPFRRLIADRVIHVASLVLRGQAARAREERQCRHSPTAVHPLLAQQPAARLNHQVGFLLRHGQMEAGRASAQAAASREAASAPLRHAGATLAMAPKCCGCWPNRRPPVCLLRPPPPASGSIRKSAARLGARSRRMARKKIREYDSKRLLKAHIERVSAGGWVHSSVCRTLPPPSHRSPPCLHPAAAGGAAAAHLGGTGQGKHQLLGAGVG